MIDVARAANVSQATVSRALHSPELVKDSTRERIRRAMEEMSYVYNAAAADFTRQKNSLIGLIVFTVRSSIQSELIDGIQEELDRTGYSLIIGNSRYEPATERRLIQAFQERQLAGIIVAESTDDNREALRAVHRAGIPIVLTWDISEDSSLDCVGIDNFQAGRDITAYLINLGHRRIGLIAGRYDRIERVRHRYDGYQLGPERRGDRVRPGPVAFPPRRPPWRARSPCRSSSPCPSAPRQSLQRVMLWLSAPSRRPARSIFAFRKTSPSAASTMRILLRSAIHRLPRCACRPMRWAGAPPERSSTKRGPARPDGSGSC